MKITHIDVMQLDGGDALARWRPVVCRIHTDEGIYGDGETAPASTLTPPTCFSLIRELAPLIIGMDPLENEVIWNKLYKTIYWGQNGGPIIFGAISALDIALWDIKGKALGLPVYKLLGGKFRDKLRAYASQLQLGWLTGYTQAHSTEDYVKYAKLAVEEGYTAIKIDFLTFDSGGRPLGDEERCGLKGSYYIGLAQERLSAVREAVGSSVDILAEGHGFMDVQSAVQFAQMAEKYNIFAFEEPVTPNPKLHELLSARTNVPIAGGERLYSRWQFAPYLEAGTLQMIQPDLGNCGGLTEGKKICDMAYTYDVGVQAHVCASPIAAAAAMQLEAAIPNFYIHEHHVYNRFDMNKRLAMHDYQPQNGYISVPDLPGIGNELSGYALSSALKVTV